MPVKYHAIHQDTQLQWHQYQDDVGSTRWRAAATLLASSSRVIMFSSWFGGTLEIRAVPVEGSGLFQCVVHAEHDIILVGETLDDAAGGDEEVLLGGDFLAVSLEEVSTVCASLISNNFTVMHWRHNSPLQPSSWPTSAASRVTVPSPLPLSSSRGRL